MAKATGKRPRLDCVRCEKNWADNRVLRRPEGPVCYRCFNRITYGEFSYNYTCDVCGENFKSADDDLARRRCTRCESEVWGSNTRRTGPLHPPVPTSHSYKLTQEAYESMIVEQAGVCAICQRAPFGTRGLVVDHNHDTGDVRGLLCVACNTGLGQFLDDPAALIKAAAYLTERGNYAGLKRRIHPGTG